MFSDVYYKNDSIKSFCYRSALAVYEEVFDKGALLAAGYNTAGYPLDVLSGYPTRLDKRDYIEPTAFNIEIDGQAVHFDLEFVDFKTEKSEDTTTAVLTLDSKVKPVRIRVNTVLDGTHMFTRFIEIENLSDEPLCLNRLAVMSGGIETMDRNWLTTEKDVNKFYSVGYFDSDQWGREGGFNWHTLTPDKLCVEMRYGRDRFRQPMIFIRNNVTGVIYFSQIGWTGGCRYTVDYNAMPERNGSTLALSTEITSHSPMTVIAPHETFVSPEVHMGAINGGFDDAVNQMHAHIRKSVLNRSEADGTACLVGAGMGAEHDMTVETTKNFIRQFKEMGAEVFIIDAGWVCPLGMPIDWGNYNGLNVPHPDRYPNDMKEISDYCHEQGLKFALWMDIETMGKYCSLSETHPEWRSVNAYGERSGIFLDFTVPEAAKWAENELARVIEEYKLDLLRVDNNISFRDYFGMRDTGSGIKECVSLKHFNAVYKMYGNLKKRFPNVIFENCAGGGGRTDLGLMKCFNHSWVSDCQRAPQSVLITNSMTMALPPERVDRLFAGMGCHETGTLDLHMRNTMLTHMSLNVISPRDAKINTQQMEFVRHSVELYKNFIRPIIPTANIYHHTPETNQILKNGHCVLEIASPDGDKGAVGVFNLALADCKPYTVIPKGIKADKKYKLTLDNSRVSFAVSGYELMTNGIKINIPSSLNSELALYEEV